MLPLHQSGVEGAYASSVGTGRERQPRREPRDPEDNLDEELRAAGKTGEVPTDPTTDQALEADIARGERGEKEKKKKKKKEKPYNRALKQNHRYLYSNIKMAAITLSGNCSARRAPKQRNWMIVAYSTSRTR